eukprot:TRINITY_DN4270_c0_g1_i11.p1 TRINITY_DN4270_c0_g1~~TRINITY_DN4270_c0_g1_i11.p1  ORF type:complete len:478 (-),score=41.01 TRINITY_DN4270_c0_g1_i11:348-1739(-)
MMLAKRGWKNITVLEKTSSASFYEPDKAYQYLVGKRGYDLLEYLDFMEEFKKASVAGSLTFQQYVKPDGSVIKRIYNYKDNKQPESYWIPRQKLLTVLHKQIEQRYASVKVEFSAKFVGMDLPLESKDSSIQIRYVDKSGKVQQLNPKLVVGCDGAGSSIRKNLEQVSENERFKVCEFPSPASGLRFKALVLPPNFTCNKFTGKKSTPTESFRFFSASEDKYKTLQMLITPCRDDDSFSPRPAITSSVPNHHIWTLKTSEDMLEYLEEQFPQLNIREEVSVEELDRFAKSEGGRFPTPSYSNGAQLQFGESGVVILGDALHFSPPNLGQGLNSAFEDVLVLQKALDETNDDITKALPLFEDSRLEDSKALVKLGQTVAAYQFGQNRLAQKLWLMGTSVSMLIHRLFPQHLGGPIMSQVNNPKSSYSEILLNKIEQQRKLQFVVGALGVVLSASLVLVNVVNLV